MTIRSLAPRTRLSFGTVLATRRSGFLRVGVLALAISLLLCALPFEAGAQRACPAGQTFCSGRCIDTSADPANCGGCRQQCQAGQACVSGSCAVAPISCASGLTLCSGTCVDLSTSVNNCGACGMACSTPNALPVCSAGRCSIGTCNVGYADCDMIISNGCEINISSDPANCGACGHACSAGQSCSAGTCQ
jgi:hypothetical protein